MELHPFILATVGGALIGIAAGSFLILSGRIAGISGVLGGLLTPTRGDAGWRFGFVGGLIAGGVGLALVYPAAFPAVIDTPSVQLVAAGLFVGFGTRLGSGCTSGHGVCGIARLSPRSLVATASFMAAGAATVVLATRVFGG